MITLSLSSAFSLLLKRDLTLAYRRRAELVNPLLFFVLVTAMFPLGIGNDPKLIESVGPGVVWVAALLAALLSLDSMFRSDFDDGSLEQFMLSAHPISILVLAAAAGKDGPGPLVSGLAKTAGDFPIPVAIVPGNLSDAELDAMA